MTPEMLHALNRHEAICVCKGTKSVTIEEVREPLTEKYDAEFAT
jgi:hypothetical protein